MRRFSAFLLGLFDNLKHRDMSRTWRDEEATEAYQQGWSLADNITKR